MMQAITIHPRAQTPTFCSHETNPLYITPIPLFRTHSSPSSPPSAKPLSKIFTTNTQSPLYPPISSSIFLSEQHLTHFQHTLQTFHKTAQLEETDLNEQGKNLEHLLHTLVRKKRQLKAGVFHTKKEAFLKQKYLEQFKQIQHEQPWFRLYTIFKEKTLRLAYKQLSEPHEDSLLAKAIVDQFGRHFIHKKYFISQASALALVQNQNLWRYIRDRTKHSLLKAHVIASSLLKQTATRPLLWLSGSKSSSLPLIVKRTIQSETPALVPTGELLKNSIAPFCGEMTFGTLCDKGVNHSYLSGVTFCSLPTALQYANRPTRALLNIDTLIANIKKLPWSIALPMDRIQLRIDLLQYLQKYSLTLQEQKTLLHELHCCKKIILDSTTKTACDALIQTIQTSTPIQTNFLEYFFIEKPFPILWASTTEQGTSIISSCKGEHILQGPQPLGEKIQFLFVPKQWVTSVRKYVKHIQGLEVNSIEALLYLHEEQCQFLGSTIEKKSI